MADLEWGLTEAGRNTKNRHDWATDDLLEIDLQDLHMIVSRLTVNGVPLARVLEQSAHRIDELLACSHWTHDEKGRDGYAHAIAGCELDIAVIRALAELGVSDD